MKRLFIFLGLFSSTAFAEARHTYEPISFYEPFNAVESEAHAKKIRELKKDTIFSKDYEKWETNIISEVSKGYCSVKPNIYYGYEAATMMAFTKVKLEKLGFKVVGSKYLARDGLWYFRHVEVTWCTD